MNTFTCMQHLYIKELTAADLPVYKRFLITGLIEDEVNFRLTPIDEQDAPFPTKGTADSFTLGVFAAGELAGIVSFERDGATRVKLRHKGMLMRMYVSPLHRGKGIAKELITELVARVKQTDIEQINLTVVNSNRTAIKLYESFGFVAFSSEPRALKWKEEYFTENQMALRLVEGYYRLII